MKATWYICEDGSVADPSEVASDAAGVLRHKDGRVVAMRGDVPRSRGVEIPETRQMQAQQSGPGYLTRDQSAQPVKGDADLEAARAEYQKVFDKKPFHGWDAAALRAKIAAKAD